MSDESAPAATVRAPRYGVLAGALLALELLAGMQTFLLATVVPLVAADLDAHQFYGVITGAAQVATFVTMPLGPWLLRRVPGLGGAFSYVVSTPDPIESPRWAWRNEAGDDLGIAAEIGRRKYIF